MFILLCIILCVKYSNEDELEDIFSQGFADDVTTLSPTVSPVAQYFTTDSTDFTEVIKSDFFVDKTLLVKELLDSEVSAFIEISTAPHFGKSTNLNMIKRFLEINVDENGNRIGNKLSKSYKTFKQSSVNISGYEEVFEKHFGKHPVILVNYKPLLLAGKFDRVLNKYKQVLLETFSLHKYLLNVDTFWSNSTIHKNEFRKYMNKESNVNLNQSEIEEGFVLLAYVLSKYYKTPVVVMIDDYDLIVDAPVSEDCRDKVYNFIVDMNNRMIESTNVNRAILTGSLLRGGIPYSPKIKSALKTYPKLLKYYGLSENELHSLLKRFISNQTEIEDATRCIVKNYSGYVRDFDVYDELKSNPRKDIVGSVWSVVQYLTCVKRINVGNVGETGEMCLTYLSVKDRARLIYPQY